jgi:hypothetical protein
MHSALAGIFLFTTEDTEKTKTSEYNCWGIHVPSLANIRLIQFDPLCTLCPPW